MSRYKGRRISATVPTTSGTPYTGVANGIWSSQDELVAINAGVWSKGLTVPNAPTIGTVTSGNALATIPFTAADTGGSSVTYLATSNDALTATGATSPISFTGLTNGTAYTFTVKAINAQGISLLSGISNSVIPTIDPLYAFTTFTFTNASATGSYGPTLSGCLAAYNTTTYPWLSNTTYFNVISGIQYWSPPVTGEYTITAAGAASTVGRGRIVKATVTLTLGVIYKILVGQLGTQNGNGSSGGGGGTFMATNNLPIIVGGGAGGLLSGASVGSHASADGQSGSTASSSYDGTGGGGSGGGGGGGSNNGWGSGGGGFTGNGGAAFYASQYGYSGAGTSFINGGTGGNSITAAVGGFGGGGGTHGTTGGGGGGGGYSGGGGSNLNTSPNNGGGGGSYGSTASPIGYNPGHGYLIITKKVFLLGQQQEFITAGTFTWVAPAGVTSVSVVAVGGGGGANYAGGGGGGLGYTNNITVTPGQSYTVVVGGGGTHAPSGSTNGGDSYFINATIVKGGGGGAGKQTVTVGYPSIGGVGGNYFGTGGGSGGAGGNGLGFYGGAAGGGAGGYSGAGGAGGYASGSYDQLGFGGSGGGGGGGGADAYYGGGGGGGVGLLGLGSSGIGGGNGGRTQAGTQGSGGSGGEPTAPIHSTQGGLYGGGAGDIPQAASGAVRIIWGSGRSFPSTNTQDI